MFKRYILASNFNRIANRFSMAKLPDTECYVPSFNITEGSSAYVITDSQTKEIHSFRFGITGLGKNFPNGTCFVRAEGTRNTNDDPFYTGSKAIFLQPELQTIVRTQRCLVLADAFVVKVENPHLVYMRDKKRPFAFAGIWSENGGIESFAIITTPSNELLYRLGIKRMPVILHQEYENRWIRPSTQLGEVLGMLSPYPTQLMNAYPISPSTTDGINDISLIQPTGKPVYVENFSYKKMSRLGKKESHENKVHVTLEERMKSGK